MTGWAPSWLRSLRSRWLGKSGRRLKPVRRQRNSKKLLVELLEDRVVPSSYSFPNFVDVSALQLNGSAASVSGALRLTPASGNQAGSAFLKNAFSLTPDTSFETRFQFQLSAGGADGFTFMVQNHGTGALGFAGGYLGYGGVGLSKSVAVEFDTWQNGEFGDPSNNYVGVLTGGNMWAHGATANPGFQLYNGSVHNAWVDYDGATNLLRVFAATTTTKPANPLFTQQIDLPAIVGSQGYVGFSAGTGGAVQNQSILNWDLTVNAPPTITGVTNNGPVSTGNPVSVTVSATDPDVGDTLSYSFDFNNDAVFEVGPQASNQASHTYAAPGNYTVHAQVQDQAGTLGATALPANLVSWWRGDANPFDSKDGNHGSLFNINGSGYASGKVGQAFSFDGVDDYVQIGAPANLRLTSALTTEAWIYATNPAMGRYQTTFNKEGEYELGLTPTGRLWWAIANSSPGWVSIDTGYAVPANQWLHVALTYDGSVIKTYVNGALVHSLAGSGPIGDAHASQNDFRIGGRQAIPDYFAGRVDELGVYNTALSAADIQELYYAGKAGLPRNAVAKTTLTVINQPPTITNLTNNGPVSAGTPATATMTAVDPNVGDTLSYSFDFNNDGVFEVGPQASNQASHTYSIPGTYTVAAQVADDKGALGTVPMPTSRVSYWNADNNTADAADGNHGSLQFGAGYSTGKHGKGSFFLEGQDDYVYVGPSNNLNFGENQNFTLEAWVRLHYPQTDHDDVIMSKWDVENGRKGVSKNYYWFTLERNTGKPKIYLGSNGEYSLTATTGVDLGQWAHVAATRTGAVVRLYINGVLNTSATLTAGSLANNDPFTIGGLYDTIFNPPVQPKHTFGGLIDEVGVYNRALSADEMRARASFVPGPVAWWSGDGTTSDAVGKHHGTLKAGASYAAGKIGQAFDFNGGGGYVGVADSAAWDFGTRDFAIDLWVKLDQVKDSMFIHESSKGFELDYQVGSGMLIFATNPSHGSIGRPWAPKAGQWYHLAVTRTDDVFRLYVDGTQLGTEQYDPTAVDSVVGELRIGGGYGFGFDIDGQIEEVAIHQRTLSAAEVKAIFNAGSQGKARNTFALSTVSVVDTTPPTIVGTTASFATSGALAAGTTALHLTFSEVVVAPANGTIVGELRSVGADGLLGTPDDPLTAVTSQSLALTFPALAESVYRLTVFGDKYQDLAGNKLDGDGNGTAGGNYVRDFVVGAQTHTLMSPGGFAFDPEFGGFGAGQLVQGTGNAFDGLNRLQVNGSGYNPALAKVPNVDVYTAKGTETSFTTNGWVDMPGMELTFNSDGSPVNISTPILAFTNNFSFFFMFRFVVDGAPGPLFHQQTPNSQPHEQMHLEDWLVGLSPGTHQVKLQVNTFGGNLLVQTAANGFNSQILRAVEFNAIPQTGPGVDIYMAKGTAENFSSNGFADMPGMELTFTADGGPVQLSTPIKAVPNSYSFPFSFRFVVDGTPRPIFHQNTPNSQPHEQLHLEDWLLDLSPGQHHVKLQVDTSGGNLFVPTAASFQSQILRAVEFNAIPQTGPGVEVYTAKGTVDSFTSNGFVDMSGMELSFTTDVSPT
jgi:hypothetical protein